MRKCQRSTRLPAVFALSLMMAAAPGLPAQATKVTIPMGTPIQLELAHHVNSKYSPPGTPVYFHVLDDVASGGALLIRKGTLVVGSVEEAKKSRAMGRAGSLELSARAVTAVDGTLVPLDAELRASGRSRTGATVGMVFAFGLPGLFTKGRMAYFDKGTILSAHVAIDREVDPGAAAPAPAQAPQAAHRGSIEARSHEVKLAIEKGKKLRPLEFTLHTPAGVRAQDLDLGSLRLVKVDGSTLPEVVQAEAAAGDRVTFDAWPVLKYCDEGTNSLEFEADLKDGSSLAATCTLTMKIKAKEKKG